MNDSNPLIRAHRPRPAALLAEVFEAVGHHDHRPAPGMRRQSSRFGCTVNADVDAADRAESPRSMSAFRTAQQVLDSFVWSRAHKARVREKGVFRIRDHEADARDLVRARVAELFGPVSASGTLTAPPTATNSAR